MKYSINRTRIRIILEELHIDDTPENIIAVKRLADVCNSDEEVFELAEETELDNVF